MHYLKDKQYYIDRYNLSTIKECLEIISVYRTSYKKMLQSEESKKFSRGDQAKGSNWLVNQHMYFIKGERYRLKEEIIQNWMHADQIKQHKYDITPEPQRIYCPDCKNLMDSSLKHLETFEEPLRMMFLFNCNSCKKKRWIYEDGIERKSTPTLCPQCKAEAEISVIKESKGKIIWKTTCPSCRFIETTVDDLEKSRSEWKKREEEDKNLLGQYREVFCSEEKGKEAYDYIESLKVANVVFDEEVKKYDSLAYQKVSLLKKMSIVDLEKMLGSLFEKEKYAKLSMDKPEVGKHIIVPFSTQDYDSFRKQEESISYLQKCIKETLEGTNWRLMSDSISYRLGYITGRLKGYESEEDFFELSGGTREKESSKIDNETRMKYAGDNVVQLARFMGEYKGVENVRKRRLEKEPDGFFLEASKGPYQCGICGEHYYGDKIWWNLDGLKCADCWRNIQEGVIPSLKRDKDDIWISEWQLGSEFDVRASTAKKLRREGLLHARELKRKDGTIYYSIYLLEENKEFLKKYPRKPRSKMVITDLLGNQVEL